MSKIKKEWCKNNPKINKGKNAPFYNKRHTDESKNKNRQAHLGKNNAMYGKIGKLSPHWNKRGELSPNWGRHHSEETKEKMRIAAKKRWSRVV